MFDLSAYLPDSLLPQYEMVKEYVVSLLEMLGIAKAVESSACMYKFLICLSRPTDMRLTDTSKARDAFRKAENSLNIAKKEKEDAEKALNRIFDPEWYGKDGEWKKLDGLCLERDTVE